MPTIKLVLLWALAITMVGIGILHFVQPKPFVRIVPKYLPAPLALVYISGFGSKRSIRFSALCAAW
jgi:uncharacterized membrane protein